MIKRSEISSPTWIGVLVAPICRLLLPLLLLRYKGFWGLRNAALRYGGLFRKCYYLYCGDCNAYIPLTVKFDGPPCLPHGISGIFIAWSCHFGKNIVIFQQVTIGEDSFDRGAPRMIGSGCYIGAGAKIIGDITIGENCRIGANCCVYKDLPANSVAVMSPMRIIQKKDLDNHMTMSGKVFEDGVWMLRQREVRKDD